jgi:hypothetical protein
MTLLKNDKNVVAKKDINLSIKDGWYFGIGFGLAMIAMALLLGCFSGIILIIFAIA